MRFRTVVAASFYLSVACVAGGCGVLLDFDPPDPTQDGAASDFGGSMDASVDMPPRDLAIDLHRPDFGGDFGIDAGRPDFGPDAAPSPCEGLHDGTTCPGSDTLICVANACVASTCGDGFVDTSHGEQCEPGADGACRPDTCTYECVNDLDCPSPSSVCLVGACSGHFCVAIASSATDCTTAMGVAGTCMGGSCAPPNCGNGILNTGEECDGTTGCAPDCHFECHSDGECQDGDPCDGMENCTSIFGGGDGGTAVTGRVCNVATGMPICTSSDTCSTSMCVPNAATTFDCVERLIDFDGDGFAPVVLGGCGTDCDDTDPFRHPGATEVCNAIDDDCNGVVDDGTSAVAWCFDADGDGFGDPATSITTCSGPPGYVRDCSDCYDVGDPTARAQAAQVHPGQTSWFGTAYCTSPGSCSFDYDCDGFDEQQITALADCSLLLCAAGSGWAMGPPPACGATAPYGSCLSISRILCLQSNAPVRQACH